MCRVHKFEVGAKHGIFITADHISLATPMNSDAKDVIFFMHGILDTSLGWVSNGVTGSSAFAAYDAGFDVWLGNSRANPPFEHEGASLY